MIFDLGQNPWGGYDGIPTVGWYSMGTVELSRWADTYITPVRRLTEQEDIFSTGLIACNLRMVLRESAP